MHWLHHEDYKTETTPTGLHYTPAAEHRDPLTPFYTHGAAYDHNPEPHVMYFGSPPLFVAATVLAATGLAMLRALPK
ncbi:hypothetical protein AAVH_17555 [Aphelenchoides avenae]|nr:hypothetical protein AAVH_17555 [Aphelenchus avenae]